ncbi:site-specific integrase [Companilactobacillus mishanensis]|uniref:site-specific integrase n=1 Tax=Companilactobacillus mishanensis TaxID=2486008 RepID=UPI000F795619|nr:site-specific integrase [Companilactobacillus mishanensis]MQS88244.1 site-specific integrase [Companilactobacillus mishanensis]
MQLYKRKAKWSYRVWYRDENGKKHSISKSGFGTKKEAQKAGEEIELKGLQSGITSKENVTFSDYAWHWIKIYKKDHITPHSYYIYSQIPKLINKTFHETKLKDISKMNYQTMLNEYGKDHVRESVSKLNSRIRAMVKDAVEERIIYSDFTYNVSISSQIKSKKPDAKYINEDEAKRLKENCMKNLNMHAIVNYEIIFALLTGCRIGEVSGLTWDNVHFRKQTVFIEHGFNYDQTQTFKKTKTETSEREIKISTELISILKKLKKQQQELFIKQGYRDERNLVFLNSNHKIISDNAANKALRGKLSSPDVNADNIITFHGLRHTHASILISHGVDVSYVSQRLGHKNIAITLNTYSHLLQKAKLQQEEKALNVLTENLG